MDYSVADSVVLTPAERAVMVEQLEALKVQTDVLMKHCKEGTAKDVTLAFSVLIGHTEYIANILNTKIGDAIRRIADEG